MSLDTPLPFDPQRPPWSSDSQVRGEYRDKLRSLDEDLIRVGNGVVAMMQPLADVTATLPADAADAAEEVSDSVQLAGANLEDTAFTMIALESPVADDLRELVAVIHAVQDLCRTARLSLHVTEHLLTLQSMGDPTTTAPDSVLGRMRTAACESMTDAIEAWTNRDAMAVVDLRTDDQHLDELAAVVVAEGHGGLDDRRSVTAAALCGRFLERIGDHAVALGSHLAWAVTGDRPTVGATA